MSRKNGSVARCSIRGWRHDQEQLQMPRLLMAADSGTELVLSIAPGTHRQSLGDAFTELREPVCRYLLALGLAAPEAEEVVQETFLRLCQHLDSDRPRDNLRGWVFRVAHNLARDEHR